MNNKTIKPLVWILLSLCLITLACSLTDSTNPSATTSFADSPDPANKVTPDPKNPNIEPAATFSSVTCTVNSSVLNIRSCAGTHCPVQDWLSQGDVLTVLYAGETWIEVQSPDGQIGWVNSFYCGGK